MEKHVGCNKYSTCIYSTYSSFSLVEIYSVQNHLKFTQYLNKVANLLILYCKNERGAIWLVILLLFLSFSNHSRVQIIAIGKSELLNENISS